MTRLLRVGITTVASAAIAASFLFGTDAIRYEREWIINLPTLALVTLCFALPGIVLILYALPGFFRGRMPTWTRYCFTGSVVACLLSASLSYAWNCIPQCNGAFRALEIGLMLAFPAGFAAGAGVFLVWLLTGYQTGPDDPRRDATPQTPS